MSPHPVRTEFGSGRPAPGGRPAAQGDLAVARVLARLLDDAIPIPGTEWRIGIDPLLGLVPGIGDALAALLSGWLVLIAARLGAPGAVLARMGLHVAIDTVVGAVPILGDAFDVGWKANARNLRLLEEWLERPGSTRQSSGAMVALVLALAVAALAGVAFAVWHLVAWASHHAGA